MLFQSVNLCSCISLFGLVEEVLIDNNEFRKNNVMKVLNSVNFHNKCFHFVNEIFDIRINAFMTADIINHILKHLFVSVFF